MDVKKDILWRVNLCFLAIIIVSVAVVGKAVYIQQAEGAYWRGLSDSLRLQNRTLEADRGTIYSEDRSMLSTSIPFFDIRIDFMADGLREKEGKRFKDNIDSLAIGLAALFNDQSAAAYKKQLQTAYNKKERYHLLKKRISFKEYQQLRELPLVRQGRNKSGFIAQAQERRLTPFGLLANRTIGLSRTYIDGNQTVQTQNVGLEKTYDSVLRGVSGNQLVRRISGGAFVPVEGSEIEPENGKDIVTTIDVNIQDITQNALMRMMVENEALEGSAIVMEVKTGKIKAIANLGKMPDGSYYEVDNYAVRTTEPGSTIKLVTLMAALEDKHVNVDDEINIHNGSWVLGRRTIRDSERSKDSILTIKQAFQNSSNVAMAKMGYQYYNKNPKEFIKHFEALRLTGKSGIDLNEEFRPVVKSPDNKSWHMQTIPSMAFGYELMISPLQMLMVYNAVANNGKLMKPYLVNAIERDGNVVKAFKPEVLNKMICSEKTLQELRNCLEGVCTEGTAKSIFKNAAYTVAGKTGTAKVNDGNYKYNDGVYQASFAGYFPADDPKYSCIVVIKNKPRSVKYYGGAVAAPVFKEIADRLFAESIEEQILFASANTDSLNYVITGYYPDVKKVMKDLKLSYHDATENAKWANIKGNSTVAEAKAIPVDDAHIPNVKGMGLKDALFLLEGMGAKVKVSGRGKVISQVPEANTIFKKGEIVNIALN